MSINACPICSGALGATVYVTGMNRVFEVNCGRCGRFDAQREFVDDFSGKLLERDWVIMSGVIRRHTDSHHKMSEVITDRSFRQIIQASGAPRTVPEQADALLLEIAHRAQFHGDYTSGDGKLVWAARSFVRNEDSLHSLCADLQDQGILSVREAGDSVQLSLTLRGWHRVSEIQTALPDRKQVFVAMWFCNQMDSVYEKGIFPALSDDCGLTPYVMLREATLNRIDDEIIAQIRRSRLLVADVTGERQSVYYEAGFAHGLGIPVVWCCNASWTPALPDVPDPARGVDPQTLKDTRWSKRLHFDTQQFHHIFWRSPNDLRIQLTERVRALALDLPVRQD